MNWRRINDLCIACGDWRIYRYPLGDPEYFELWQGKRFVCRYASADAARAAAAGVSHFEIGMPPVVAMGGELLSGTKLFCELG